MFANYTNVLGFFAGNEVSNNKSNTDASAFVKAAVRDTKKYMSDKKYRSIPVGYSSNDDEDIRVAIADYFACGDSDESADFFGINMYEWCGDSSFKSSGYEARTEEYKNLSIPIFFSEYGCNAERPRKFTEIGTIYGDDMTDVWSGGIVYMYFQEDNDYGLVSVDGDTVKTLSDFKYYSSEMNNISPSLAQSSEVSDSASTIACPTSAATWSASTKLPPTPDSEVCKCMASSLSCVLADDVDTSDYSDLYGYICDKIDCSDISSDGKKGKYGDYSFCSDEDKLSYVLNAYYKDQNEDKSACDFSGSASINKDAKTDATCASSEASESGESSSGSTSGSGSGASGTADSDSSNSKGSSATIVESWSISQLIGITTIITSFIGGISFVLFD
ncbi:hypothetical protein CANTEDRAFT_114565 [Yamadazyma tenuis ATCC 10573]|nr:uncharacterized protein CANTEDRAFT_114565 [Yamadazyma tenuis ATCC 10573]EGV63600.1 hypothetical protein CANTEDRAFT_114565 [Yamadazyma tenuis ATCC 10573]